MFGKRKLLIPLVLVVAVLSAAAAQAASSTPTALPQSADDVDPIDDLAGTLIYPLSSSSGTLYTTASDESSVLASLGATSSDGTTFTANVNGAPVKFDVVVVMLPFLFLPPADLVCANRVVRVYRRAQCVTIIPAGARGCIPFGTGGQTLQWRSLNKCRRGGGYCIEINQIWWTRTSWNESNCLTRSAIATGNDFICN